MITNIYLTKKLEKTVSKEYLKHDGMDITSPLGKWNATLFYVSRKKCWLVTNALTRYSVILPGIKVADLKKLDQVFIKNLSEQLIYDGISLNLQKLETIIGNLQLNSTDADRSITATQNYILQYLDTWRYEFAEFENWDFRDITKRLNTIPYEIFEWFYPNEKMEKVLSEIL